MSLYLEHFGLREAPFRITPHTDFFYSGANRGPTLDALIYAITQDEGIVKVTGEVGSGKTMLCRMLLERLPVEVETLYLANPSLSRSEILGAIADELDIPADGKTTHSLIRALQNALVRRYAEGKRVVLLIDEAHAMPAESLEEIRLLSNLESKANKLLQIALFAQPELDDRLAANDMRQLRERITQHFNLSPLKPRDVASYIEFRLRAAGYRGPNPFSERAVEAIAQTSEGLSRRINILADKALLAAYSEGKHQIDRQAIKTAITDARFSPLQAPSARRFLPLAWGLGGILGLGLIAAIILYTSAPPSAATPSATAVPSSPAIAEKSSVNSSGVPAAPPPKPASATNPTSESSFGPLTEQYLARFEPWLAKATPEHFFIQLLSTDTGSANEIELFLSKATRQLDPEALRAYRSRLSGRDRISVIYGDYPSREAAQAALRTLPDNIRLAQPYPRTVKKLQP